MRGPPPAARRPPEDRKQLGKAEGQYVFCGSVRSCSLRAKETMRRAKETMGRSASPGALPDGPGRSRCFMP